VVPDRDRTPYFEPSKMRRRSGSYPAPFHFLRSLGPFSIEDLIMPVVDERLIARAMALRKQGRTQEEIAVEVGLVQSTVSTILRQHGLGGKLVKAQKLRRRS
jgi:hypothetical protein